MSEQAKILVNPKEAMAMIRPHRSKWNYFYVRPWIGKLLEQKGLADVRGWSLGIGEKETKKRGKAITWGSSLPGRFRKAVRGHDVLGQEIWEVFDPTLGAAGEILNGARAGCQLTSFGKKMMEKHGERILKELEDQFNRPQFFELTF